MSRIPPVLRPEHPAPRPLLDLLGTVPATLHGRLDGLSVTGVTLSTGDLHPGDLFVGVRGEHRHGAEFAADAAAKGAVAVMTDAAGRELAAGAGLPVLVVDDPRAVLGAVSAWVYRTLDERPLLFGVTGTNGKTSTAYLLDQMLRQLGMVAGLSSTAERRIADERVVSRLTTPEATEMHALLARMREAGVEAVAVEVSAQALSRHRVDGIPFDVVGFTNLTHDHLDDYADMEEYYRAKLPLFFPEHGCRGVVSLDSEYGARVMVDARIPVVSITARPEIDADWRVTVTHEDPFRTDFTLRGPGGVELRSSIPIIGHHMAANAGLALVLLLEAGIPLERVRDAVHERAIEAYLPGRTERVSGDRGPSVFVDFGHSPDAFENTLAAVRRLTTGRTIMVFGADGDRDATKRHDMARVAAEGCDILVITDHHPRFEDPASIRATLLEGAALAQNRPEIHEVSPPEQAIRVAVNLAREGDSILWAGPGHQDYRDIRGVRTPYSARDEARAALREAGW